MCQILQARQDILIAVPRHVLVVKAIVYVNINYFCSR